MRFVRRSKWDTGAMSTTKQQQACKAMREEDLPRAETDIQCSGQYAESWHWKHWPSQADISLPLLAQSLPGPQHLGPSLSQVVPIWNMSPKPQFSSSDSYDCCQPTGKTVSWSLGFQHCLSKLENVSVACTFFLSLSCSDFVGHQWPTESHKESQLQA